ncbi:MAG: hypothetical protein DSZ28_06725 [Thiothrix sp.]|nr:MAG: hypothetical protein DSZ28_06725 [Thiothrix sp.]
MKKLIFIAFIFLSLPLSAGPDHERADWVRMIHELDYCISDIEVMRQAYSDNNDIRLGMNYHEVTVDLLKIRDGIADVLAGVLVQPNNIPPINGEYSFPGDQP